MLLSSKEAAEIAGVGETTIRRWADKGLIKYERTKGNHRRIEKSSLQSYINAINPVKENEKITIGYARVSTKNRESDLNRQIQVIELFCAAKGWQYKIISDIGSGINYNKHGLNELIELIEMEKINRIVINYKDRLLRFGSEIIFKICTMHNVEVVIISDNEEKSFQEEMTEDILSIITVFSAKLYGSRSHQNKKIIEENEKLFSSKAGVENAN